MKFVTFTRNGQESWGLVRGEEVADLGRALPQYPTLKDFLASTDFDRRDDLLAEIESDLRLDDIRLAPVIPRPEKVICLSRNYMAHQKEAVAGGLDRKVTDYPPIFLRHWRTLVGSGQDMLIPKVSEQLDWEGELAVVLGKGGRHITEEDAMSHVAGYACFNEGSVRDYQHHAYQITPGKNFQNTGPFGPWLVTPDEVGDPHELDLEVRIDGEVVQSCNTRDMIFRIPRIINYCSEIFELAPGDVLVTGTPAGVGWGRNPKRWLKPGEVVEVEIEKVGLLSNTVQKEVTK